jgi:hypothetical protein
VATHLAAGEAVAGVGEGEGFEHALDFLGHLFHGWSSFSDWWMPDPKAPGRAIRASYLKMFLMVKCTQMPLACNVARNTLHLLHVL